MKSHILILSIIMSIFNFSPSSADYDFDKAWEEVEKMIQNRLPESALKKSEEILTHAERLKNEPQQIKSLVYIAELTIQTQEDGIDMVIKRFKDKINKSKAPVNRIISSYLAEIYENYFSQNRWDINQRTEIDGDQGEDFKTWSAQKFIAEIEQLYFYSIEDPTVLNIPIDEYHAILKKYDKEAVDFRPFLYDVLVDRLFNFFNHNSNFGVSNPNDFQIEQEWYFGDVETFTKLEIGTKNTDSNLYKLLKLYQDVLKRYYNGTKLSRSADYDFKRLNFVYSKSTLPYKDSLYEAALRKMAKSYESVEYYTNIMGTLADQVSKNKNDSLANHHALEICNEAIKKYPKSPGVSLCQIIIESILRPSIDLTGEAVYPADKDMLYLVEYKNTTEAVVDFYKLDLEYYKKIQGKDRTEILDIIKSYPKVKSDKTVLKEDKDYNSQSKEWVIEGLPFGRYAAIITGMSTEGNQTSYLNFRVSNLSWTSYSHNGTRTVFVSDNVSGKPVEGATVRFMGRSYNSKLRLYDDILLATGTTDKTGKFEFPEDVNNSGSIIVFYGNDKLESENYLYGRRFSESKVNRFAEFYTDRAIYRPGQTLYFKAILLENDTKRIPSLLKNQNVTVTLRDANGKELSKTTKLSNEFGSINGSFTLPTGTLNGNFTLIIEDRNISGYKSIRVEEYKRPTFEIKMERPEVAVQLDKSVNVTGSAISLAGVPLDKVKVSYTVTRKTVFPYWRWWSIPSNSEDFIVKTGVVETDNDGRFEVNFEAMADKTISPDSDPIFNYVVEVEVTDVQGETREGSLYLSAGYKAFVLTTQLGQSADVSNLDTISVKAYGASGQNIDIKGKIEIVKLKEPEKVQVEKYWRKIVDYPISAGSLNKILPHYPVQKKNDYSHWLEEKTVLVTEFSTSKAVNIKGKLESGVYKITTKSQDDDGKEIMGVDYIEVTHFKSGKFPKSEFLFSQTNQLSYQPGDNYELSFGTPDKDIYVTVFAEKDGKIIYSNNLLVKNTEQISIPITESLRGGFTITWFYTKENRHFTQRSNVAVPWSNKELTLVYETFRDKTLPGSEEEYRIKIGGLQKDNVAAEVVAAMYDASLDQFVKPYWRTQFYPSSYSSINLNSSAFNAVYSQSTNTYYNRAQIREWVYPELISIDINYYFRQSGGIVMRAMAKSSDFERMAPPPVADNFVMEESLDATEQLEEGSEEIMAEKTEDIVQIRKNLNETVFFFPDMKTDADGNLVFSFKMNEALTRWKLMTLAHTTDMKVGYDERFVQTQKDLMVLPNAPRFLRDGDKISFSAKVSNMSSQSISGTVKLQMWDALTMEEITDELIVSSSTIKLDLVKQSSEGVSWEIIVPSTKYSAITFRVTALSGTMSDAEENTLPVITNSVLVTETMPFWLTGKSSKDFRFAAFINNNSGTKTDFRYTFEYTSNPVWYAIQAMPYIQSGNNPGTQVIADRLYANILASAIANSHPKIKAVFDQWKLKDKDALISNLSKNEELKSAILEETPWVRQAMSETEQKQNIAILFDLNTMASERNSAIDKLRERQLPNGGFPWFPAGRDNIYTTQQIVESLGHLHRLGALEINDRDIVDIISGALVYMDESIVARYEKLKKDIKQSKGDINADHLDNLSIHYLYVRSLFSHVKASKGAAEASKYYLGQIEKYWTKRGIYTQSLSAFVLMRNDNMAYKNIIKSLKERSFFTEEMGRYWNEGNGYFWYQLPIERQAALIELFIESGEKSEYVDQMKVWLIKNKQTNHWSTSKGTASAIYALLIQGEEGGINNWVTESTTPIVKVGKETLDVSVQKAQAGTGYIKKSWTPDEINKEMGVVSVTNNNSSVSWGAAYYQYFEDADKIKSFVDTPLKLEKKLYKVVSGDRGESMSEIDVNTTLKPGDKIMTRLTLRVDRDMEYVHLKDMRPSGLEPTNVLSSYKYQGGLGYYETTQDLASHFYFSILPKGTYVFEYPLRAVHSGDFSAGIANIECMYAPEFSSHSEGTRLIIR